MRNPFRSKFRVTQEFGVNKAYYSKFGLSGHEGIDLVPTGTVWDVLCLADGVVVKDEDNSRSGAYGINVTVWHPVLRKATQYCHLKENYVQNGQKVKTGDKIGLMGSTGNVTGAHVHLNLFETDVNGIRLNKNNGFLGGINPLPFLNEEAGTPDTSALDECKKQVEDEIRKKNETYQELQEVKSELAKLDEIKDQLRQTQKKVEDLQQTLAVSTQEYAELKGRLEESVEQSSSLSGALQEATEKNKGLEALYKKLEASYDDLKEDQKFNYKHLLFGLYIREVMK